MKAFLGVTRKRSFLELEKGSNNFWCVRPSHYAESGDIVALYFTGMGILQIYLIDAVDETNKEYDCSERQMQTVRTTLVVSLDNSITAKQMGADPILKHMTAVRRKFQGTVFKISMEEWAALVQIIQEQNPNLEL